MPEKDQDLIDMAECMAILQEEIRLMREGRNTPNMFNIGTAIESHASVHGRADDAPHFPSCSTRS